MDTLVQQGFFATAGLPPRRSVAQGASVRRPSALRARRLDNQIAVVTVAGEAGLLIAGDLAAAGAQVVVAGQDRAFCARATLRVAGAATEQVDFVSAAQIDSLSDTIIQRYGRIDILVNSAGVWADVSALDMNNASWRRHMALSVDSVFYFCRAFGWHMVAAGRGSIINVSGRAGLGRRAAPPSTADRVAEAAIIEISRSLAGEWAPHGVRVAAVAADGVAHATKAAWHGNADPDGMAPAATVAEAVLLLATGGDGGMVDHVLIIE
jgi:NAD(P)-dependent dehydrogenase (short-subunit alcohol dehydrogenase family)